MEGTEWGRSYQMQSKLTLMPVLLTSAMEPLLFQCPERATTFGSATNGKTPDAMPATGLTRPPCAQLHYCGNF